MTERVWTVRRRPEAARGNWESLVLVIETPERPKWKTSTYWLGWNRVERRLSRSREFLRLSRLFPEVLPRLVEHLERDAPLMGMDGSRPEPAAGTGNEPVEGPAP